jgi:hypothetical protein
VKDVLSPSILEAIMKQGISGKIHINSFSDKDIITVATMHSEYYIEIGEIVRLTSNNPRYQGPYNSYLIGTTIAPGSSIISSGCFAIGGCMELVIEKPGENSKKLITSEVVSVSVNGIQFLPTLKEVS